MSVPFPPDHTRSEFVTPPKPRRRWPWIVALPVAFFVGMVAMSAANTPTAPVAAEHPAPAPTVTVTAKAAAPVVKTRTVPGPTVTVTAKPVVRTVTPAACGKALDEADRIVAAFQWETDWIVRYLTAASEFDVDKMTDLNGEISGKTDEYAGVVPAYKALAATCR